MLTPVNIPNKKKERSTFQKVIYQYYSITALGIIVLVNIVIALIIALIFQGDIKDIVISIIVLHMFEGIILMMSVLSLFYVGRRPISKYEPMLEARLAILGVASIALSIILYFIFSPIYY